MPAHLLWGGDLLTESHYPLGFAFDFERKFYVLFLFITMLVVLAARNLSRSNTGPAMMAVRDRDVAAAVMGVNPGRTKITAFGLSSFLAGIVGGMFAIQQQYLTVEPPFNLLISVQYIAMIVIGGIGTCSARSPVRWPSCSWRHCWKPSPATCRS